ncbi:hypothetical protein PybrP1_004107 [[Pythium] brassicae (nom. inval.)]|nr:hypothetical protein PybrP1_004107 [[Pythium] brassicae (nom. inval.)]
MPSALMPHVDELVMEYLLFRGFTKSFQVFAAERKRDRAKGFDAEQIIAQLLELVQTFQVDALLETWKFLNARFFHHLDASYAERAQSVQALETSLLRLYVVNAVKSGRREKATEFFQSLISSLSILSGAHANKLNATIPASGADASDSWGRWFILPFLQQPESDTYFRVFFAKDWLDAFLTTLRNFLALVFRNLALPKLLAFQLTRLEEPALKMRLKVSQSECNRLRLFNVEANARIKKLEDAGRQLHKILRRMVQHSYCEQFARSEDHGAAAEKGGVATRRAGQTGSVGFTPQQLEELGELFGICRKDRVDEDGADGRAEHTPPIYRGLAAGQTRAATLDADSDEEAKRDNDPESPATSSSALSSLSSRSVDDNGALSSSSVSIALSLVRAIAASRESSLTSSVRLATQQAEAAHICRVSHDGKFVASGTVAGKAVAVHSTAASHTGDDDSVATIRLLAPLRVLSWITSGGSEEQVLLLELADGTLNAWGMAQQRVVSRLQTESGGAQPRLIAATAAPTCLLVVESSANKLVCQASWSFEEEIACVACDASLSVFATASRSGRIRVFDANLRHPVLKWHPSLPSSVGAKQSDSFDTAAPIRALAFSPDGTSLLSVAASEARAITEWAWADEATAAGAADLTSNDSSDDGFARDFDSSTQAALGTPRIVCSYALRGDIASPGHRFELTFHPEGRQFILTTRLGSRVVGVDVYKNVALGSKDFADFDCWLGASSSPLCCTSSGDGSLALWHLKNAS